MTLAKEPGLPNRFQVRVGLRPGPQSGIELERARDVLGSRLHIACECLHAGEVVEKHRALALRDQMFAQKIRAANEQHSDDPILLYDLACFESLAGEVAAAAGHIARSLELDPGLRAGAEGDSDLEAVRAAGLFR